MYFDKHDLDRRTRAGVDAEPGLQSAAKSFNEAHPQGFALGGITPYCSKYFLAASTQSTSSPSTTAGWIPTLSMPFPRSIRRLRVVQ
jgi:hypothetical protein